MFQKHHRLYFCSFSSTCFGFIFIPVIFRLLFRCPVFRCFIYSLFSFCFTFSRMLWMSFHRKFNFARVNKHVELGHFFIQKDHCFVNPFLISSFIFLPLRVHTTGSSNNNFGTSYLKSCTLTFSGAKNFYS